MSAFLTVRQLADETGWDEKLIYKYAKDERDPLPIYYVKGRYRGGVVVAQEVTDWIHRNSRMYAEKD